MMGLHQLSPSRSFLVAYGTDDDPVERDSLGTAIGCLAHAGRLSNPRANCQFKMNDPLRCYISETLTEPLSSLRPGSLSSPRKVRRRCCSRAAERPCGTNQNELSKVTFVPPGVAHTSRCL